MNDRRHFIKQAGLLALSSSPVPGSPLRPHKSQSNNRPILRSDESDVVLENDDFRLVIGSNGVAESLLHKPSRQECLAQIRFPVFTLTQYRPYDNELQLSYPAKPTAFPADNVRRENNDLVVSFALVGYEAKLGIKITDSYIAFTLQDLNYVGYTRLRPKRQTPIDETVFFQIPVRRRANFGEWLNVVWDDKVAVNVLATDPYARIDAICSEDYCLLRAGTVDSIQTIGVGAALIITDTSALLDKIGQLENDFNLPRGVESRHCQEYKHSYYEVLKVTPENIDRHIRFAQMGGFRLMDVYYRAFAKTSGHFAWRPEFPNEMRDLRQVVETIDRAGITPGIHIHYNKADKQDEYVTPYPDSRLNLTNSFTLKSPLDATSTTITVQENPRQCTLDKDRRILKIQNELITYETFKTNAAYQFLGCGRGALGTKASSYVAGSQFGLLDVDTWPLFVRFTQDTDIQQEVAKRLALIYREAGFRFVYFDGAEDVPGPEYWHTVSRAQWIVYKELQPGPLLAEGACKSHFSWHILTRGNAFDVFKPEVLKEAIRAYPAAEAPQVAKDFTSINFGWIGYWAPSTETIGTQPDMIEYATSRAAGWDCPVSLVGDLEALEANPRTPDNLEVIKRWEDARAKSWISEKQKVLLRDLAQEHTLLINEQGKFELVPYLQIVDVAGKDRPARAFHFERSGRIYVFFWHMSGNGELDVPLRAEGLRLMEELGKPLALKRSASGVTLPLGRRRYLECTGLGRQSVVQAFQNATLLSG